MSSVAVDEADTVTTDFSPPRRRSGRGRLIVGYLAIVAILPYFTLKLAWISGSTVGITSVSPVDAAVVTGGNIVTAAMEVVAAFVILTFTHDWGLRAPAWLVLIPTWIATGLLAPFIITGPVIGISVISGSGSVGDRSLAPWVGPLVYISFGAQAIGIGLSFILYARARWPRVLSVHLAGRPTGPYRSVLILFGWLTTALLAIVIVSRFAWALNSTWGLSSRLVESRGIAERLADAATALFALAAATGLLVLAYRRWQKPAWVPVALVWVGAGAVFANGIYPMMLLLAGFAGSGTTATQTGLVPFVDFIQTITGTAIAVTGAFILVELDEP